MHPLQTRQERKPLGRVILAAISVASVVTACVMIPFLMKRLRNVRTEMALSVLAYNLTRVMNILGIEPLMAAMRA